MALTPASSRSSGGDATIGADGWVDDSSEVWTYASFAAGPPAVGTFTVTGDQTAKYHQGTRIKLTQTTAKYFLVTASSHVGGITTVSITGGTDYTLANAAITAPFHSYAANPQGFPTRFSFDAGTTGFVTPSTNCVFTMIGRCVFITYDAFGTSNATTFTWTAPVAVSFLSFVATTVRDNGTYSSGSLHPVSTTGFAFGKALNTAGGFTASGNKHGVWSGFYFAA